MTQTCSQFLLAELKSDIEANYDCAVTEIEYTIVKDTDRDGVYDTYVVKWCNNTIDTYPICALGDIRRWPPTGIPTRDIIQTDFDQRILVEEYYEIGNRRF